MEEPTTSDSLYTAVRDEESAERPVETVLRAVSEVTGQEMKDLPVLHETIDGDALNQIFHGAATDVQLEFVYADHLVTVQPELVTVSSIDDQETTSIQSVSSATALSED